MKRMRALGLVMACGLAGGLGSWAAGGIPGIAGAADSGASAFTPLPAPQRVYDSRGPAGDQPRLPADTTVTVNVTAAGVPVDATSVVVNIAMTETTGPGFITAWSGDSARPLAAAGNTTAAGQNISNSAIVSLAADRTFKLYTNSSMHLVVDVNGYFTEGTSAPATPTGKFEASITSYTPDAVEPDITKVGVTVANVGDVRASARVELTCPGRTLANGEQVLGVPAGTTVSLVFRCVGTALTDGAGVEVFPI